MSDEMQPLSPAPEVKALVAAVLTGAGTTPAALRQAAEALAARRGGAERPRLPLPPELERYVTMVADGAHALIDEDLKNLKDAGYSEDALFEVTVSAALGAGPQTFCQARNPDTR